MNIAIRNYARHLKWKIIRMNKLATVRVAIRDLLLAQYDENNKYSFCDIAFLLDTSEESKHVKNNFENTVQHRYKKSDKRIVELDKNLKIISGYEYLADTIDSGSDFVTAIIYNFAYNREYGSIDWFWEKGFSRQECLWLSDHVYDALEKSGYTYFGIIWPPVFNDELEDEYTADIREYCALQGFEFFEKREYSLTKDQFRGLFDAVYYTDSVRAEKLEKKWNYISSAMGEKADWRIKTFSLRIKDSRMRIKDTHYMPQSEAITKMKKTLRYRVAPRMTGYRYDIALHITDDYYQSHFLELLFKEIDSAPESVFESICRNDYCSVSSNIKAFLEDRNCKD